MGTRKTKKMDGPKRKKMEPTCENKKNGFKKNEKSHMRNTTTEKDSNGGDMKRNERTDVEMNRDMRYLLGSVQHTLIYM